jgi:hypothetical protein
MYNYRGKKVSIDYAGGNIPVEGVKAFVYNGYGSLKSSKNEYVLSIPNGIGGQEIKEPQWFWKNSGEPIPEGTTTLTNSMIESVTAERDSDEFFNQITLNVKKQYDSSYAADNYFMLKYKVKDQTYTQTVPIQFSLEGEMGTNGTGWVSYIEPKENKNVLNDTENDEVLFSIGVYKDGV